MKTQAYRFGKSQFTPEEAKAWLKSKKIAYVSFEPANTPEKKEERKDMMNRIAKELSNAVI